MPTFEDLDAFRAAIDLMVAVYRASESFPRHENYGLTSQIRRASVSVVSHIAEGQGRITAGEWRQLLSQARGSLYEVQAQCIVASKLGYLDDQGYAALKKRADKAGQCLGGLIRFVRRREARKLPTRPKVRATSNENRATTASSTTPSPSSPSS